LDQLALAIVLKCTPVHISIIMIIMLVRLIVLDCTIFDQLLLHLLLTLLLLLLVHLLHAHLFFFCFTSALCLFLLDTLLFFLLSASISFLLFLATGFLFSTFALFFLSLLLRGSLCFHFLLLSFAIVTGSCAIVLSGTASEDLLDVRRGVDASCCCAEHRLQKGIGLFWLVTSHNLARLDIQFLTDD